MKWFYFRWGAILLAGVVVAFLGVQRYVQEVTTISPEQLLEKQPHGTVRVLGMVRAGSLMTPGETEGPPHAISFYLEGEKRGIAVRFTGESTENLRELKKLVLVGKWNTAEGLFEGYEISILPNYGYVVAAYLIGMIPIGLFLFRMERKVELLYTEIRTARPYEPEESSFDKG